MSIPQPLSTQDVFWLGEGAIVYQADPATGVIYTCRRCDSTLSDAGVFARSIDGSLQPVPNLLYQDAQNDIHHNRLTLFATKADAQRYLEAQAPIAYRLLVGDIVLITGTKTIPADFLGQLAVVTETFTDTERVLIQVKVHVGSKGSLSCGANRNEIRRVGHDPELLGAFAQTTFDMPDDTKTEVDA